MEEVIINYDKKVMKLEQENKRLHSIIKEVREYIEKLQTNAEITTYDILDYEKKDILEILDKGND